MLTHPSQGSHLCHNSFCVVPSHLAYEPSEVNQSRIRCADEAKRLRQERDTIPAACQVHDPPCLLQVGQLAREAPVHVTDREQHAALTTYERILIQIWVLRRSMGLDPALDAPSRPRWHTLPTLESTAPPTFCRGAPAVTASDEDLFNPIEHKGRIPRPELTCPFCSGIKSFASVVGYWGHITHHHNEIADESRLQQVRSAAARWGEYCSVTDPYRAKDLLTMVRVRQARGSNFTWQDVMAWGLRP